MTSTTLSARAFLLVWACTLLDEFGGLPVAGYLAGVAMLLFLLLEFGRQRRYAQVLFLTLTGIGLVGVASAADPAALFLAGWRRGASYGAFFLALTALRDVAETSPLVRRCGHHLVAQPPGRRYAALTGGGHLFGVILSYGTIELLGAMVMRANTLRAAGGSDLVRTLRTRRMLMAIYRGFAVMNCWSPLNLMTAVVSTAIPGAPMRRLLPLAFVVSIVMAAVGWIEDRYETARLMPDGTTSRHTPRPVAADGWSIHLGIVGLVGLVILLAECASALVGVSLVAAVTLVVPMVGASWAIVQGWRFISATNHLNRVSGVLRRRVDRFVGRIPTFRAEATVLAGSGFMGVSIGGVLPGSGLAPVIAILPPLAIPLLVPVLLIVTGQLGLNPVAVVALIGAAMPDPTRFGVAPAELAFACMLGWGLAVNMTPMSASAIITARWANVSPWTVSTRWNAKFTFYSLLVAWVAIAAIDRFFTPS